MVTQLVRLKRFVTKPLWVEAAEDAKRRRLRTLVGVPFAAMAGLAWGIQAASTMITGSVALWGAVGAAALACFIYVEQRVTAPLAEAIVRRHRFGGRPGVVVLETAMLGGALLALTRLIEVPNVPSAEFVLGIGAFYVVTMETLLGRIPQSTAALLTGNLGSGPRVHDHSEIDTLVSRGEFDEAIRLSRRAIEARPLVAALYIRLYRILMRQRDYEGVLEVLENCYRSARLEPKQEEFIVHQIYEVCRTKLHESERAAFFIEDWMDRTPDSAHGAWASNALLELEAGASPGDEVGDDSSTEAELPPPGEITLNVQARFEPPTDFEVPPEQRVDDDFLFGDGAFGTFWTGPAPHESPPSDAHDEGLDGSADTDPPP